jgi:hypothetical protein
MRGLLGGRPPNTVVVLAAFVAGAFLFSLVAEEPHDRLLAGGIVLLIVTLGLVHGVWAAWLFLVVMAVSGIVGGLDWPTWRGAAEIVAVNAIMLVLLLAPTTRPSPAAVVRGFSKGSDPVGLRERGREGADAIREPVLEHVARGFRSVLHAELAVDVVQVELDRLFRHPQLSGDRLIG